MIWNFIHLIPLYTLSLPSPSPSIPSVALVPFIPILFTYYLIYNVFMLPFKLKQTLFKLEIQILSAFILALTFFTFLSFWGNFTQVSSHLLHFPLRLIILSLFTTLLNYTLRFLRFKFLLHRSQIFLPTYPALLVFFSGLAMTVTPAKSGELTKAYFIKKLTPQKTSFSQAAPIVIYERLTDALGTLILMSWGLWHYPQTRLLTLFVGTGIIVTLIIISHQAVFDYIYYWMKKIAFLDFLVNHMTNFHQSLKKLFSFKTLIISSFLALVAWSFEVITFSLVYYGLVGNIDFNTIAILAFIFTFTSILGFLAIIPGGLGVTEGSKLGLLTLFFNLSKSTAVSIVILVRLFTLWFGVSLGVIALLKLTHLINHDY